LTLAIWFALWTIVLVPLYPNASAKLPGIFLEELGPLAALILLRFGFLRQASLAYLAGTWAFATFTVARTGGIRSPTQVFYGTLPILATWLLGYRGALWTAGGCLGTALFFAVLELAGVNLTPRFQPTPLGIWALLMQVIFIGAVPVGHVLRTLGDTLAQSRRTEEELERYKKHLELVVRERTAQLGQEREFLDALVRHAPYPIAVVKGRELRYTIANPAYEALVGPDARIVGRTHREVFPETAALGGELGLLKTIETEEPWLIQDFSAPIAGGPERI
jgi:PAS domain-containing protein